MVRFKTFIPLRGGGYAAEWRIAREADGKIQPIGMKPLEPGCRHLLHAHWCRPIEPPHLDAPPSTALALELAGNRQYRKNRRGASSSGEPPPSLPALAVAESIVESLVIVAEVVADYFRGNPQDRAALVEQVAALVERNFGGGSVAEES